MEIYDQNRFMSHIEKIKLVKGDVLKTLPKFLTENHI